MPDGVRLDRDPHPVRPGAVRYGRYDLCAYTGGTGWWPILDEYVPKIEALGGHIEQAYEKYGTLRIDIMPYSDELDALADEAEQRSAITCEWCGQPGVEKELPDTWVTTLCDDCFNAAQVHPQWSVSAN